MSVNIFTYGTLMYSDVWDKVVSGNYLASSAVLRGYARRAVRNELYPVAFEASQHEVISGIVYYDVDPLDVYRLDCFEGEYYFRTSVNLELPQLGKTSADVYIVKPRHKAIISDQIWDPHHFQQNALSEFIAGYEGF